MSNITTPTPTLHVVGQLLPRRHKATLSWTTQSITEIEKKVVSFGTDFLGLTPALEEPATDYFERVLAEAAKGLWASKLT